MSKFTKRLTQVGPAIVTLALATPALAQTGDWRNWVPFNLQNIAGGDLPTLIRNVISILLVIAGVVAMIYLIVAGYQYITAGGNAEQATLARQGILNAIIGLVVIFASYLIINFIFMRLHF